MILPTIIGVSEAALRAVPMSYYEGAVAMGARHERAIFTVMVPAAKSGVLAGIGIGIVALPLSIFVLSCKAPPVAAVKPSGRVAEVRGGENQSACLRIHSVEGNPAGAGRDAARFRIGPSSCGSIT